MGGQEEIDEFYEFILNLVKEAGKIMKEGFYGNKSVELKGSKAWDLVTDYDKKIEIMIITSIRNKFPGHQFIAEESSSNVSLLQRPELTDAPTWIIDPIDGTVNFVHMMPITCISIALAVNKELVIGIVYNPIVDQLFTARKDKGAFLNDRKLTTSQETEIERSLICLDIKTKNMYKLAERYKFKLLNVDGIIDLAQSIRSIGSAALALCYVAMGAAEAYVSDGLACWDIAAGVLITREAGGYVCSSNGGELDLFGRRIMAASSKRVADHLLRIIEQTRSK